MFLWRLCGFVLFYTNFQQQIKKQQEDITKYLKEIGFVESQKHGLLHKYAGIVQDAEEFKAKLEEEYGGININLEDGSYTMIDAPKTEETKASE